MASHSKLSPSSSLTASIRSSCPSRTGSQIPSAMHCEAALMMVGSSPSEKTILFVSFLAMLITLRMMDRVRPRRASSSSRYPSTLNSFADTLAMPSLTAASATALASQISTRASNGFGMRYSGPNCICSPPSAAATSSGTGCLASSAIAWVAAIFMHSVISLALTSSAPRKM